MKYSQVQIISVYVLSVLGGLFLFFGGPDYYSPRSYRLAWDLGHICVFFLWTLALMKTWKGFAKRPLQTQLVLILTITLCVGFLIELAQSGSHRTFSIEDIFRNIIGSTAAIVFLSPSRKALPENFFAPLK